MKSSKRSASLLVALAIVAATLVTGAHAVAQEKILHNFGSKANDGGIPTASLVFDAAGNLYGTTSAGGANRYGTVFELSPAKTGGWFERILFNFNRVRPGIDPLAGLIFDGSGNLYGTTFESGVSTGGVAFELRHWPDGGWSEKVVGNFGGFTDNTLNGTLPEASLTFDAAGNLYGTTSSGGVHGDGTVFQLTPGAGGIWTETILHAFAGHGTDGTGPRAGLIFDSSGNLYGTTFGGGAHSYGTVFELSPVGDGTWSETLLHSFEKNDGDGLNPDAGLTFDASGNLYGTTFGGGAYLGNGTNFSGTVFELSPAAAGEWTETVIHSFGSGADGGGPLAGLTFDGAGNLYGTTRAGGAYGLGTVFKLTPASGGGWTEAILHSFGKGRDGAGPRGGLIFDASGNLYGTTTAGGFGSGTVFEITP